LAAAAVLDLFSEC